MSEPVVECVPNFSEGTDARRVEAIVTAMRVEGVRLLDWSMDADHNRSVVTIAGTPSAVVEAAVRGVGKAVELIDLTRQQGVHPRIGAADVVPFVPISGIKLEQCALLARQAGLEIWRRYEVPVFFYEAAAARPDRIESITIPPLAPERTELVPPPPPETKPAEPTGGTETILLVEDEPSVRGMVSELLQHYGYQVIEAVNGVEALVRWEESRDRITLLLTDVIMPGGMSGVELARRLREEQPHLKVVFTSGYNPEAAGRELELRNGENFVAKPCTSEQLLSSIRRALTA